jgi:hypothetical protein
VANLADLNALAQFETISRTPSPSLARVFHLQGFAGVGTSAAAVAAFIASRDDDAGSVVDAGSGTTINYSNAVCSTPRVLAVIAGRRLRCRSAPVAQRIRAADFGLSRPMRCSTSVSRGA